MAGILFYAHILCRICPFSRSYSFLVYFDLSLTNLLIIGTIILIFAKILMFYKWIKLFFFHQFGALFLLILYFCALEILPCLLLYQGMIQINNILLIKF